MRWVLALVFLALTGATVVPALALDADQAQAMDEAAQTALANGDTETAIRLFHQLADADNPRGLYNLGHLYFVGQGVPEDREMAFALHKRSADHPDMQFPHASYSVGMAYLSGEVVPRDVSMAATYLTHAANMNFGPAEYELGMLYRYQPSLDDTTIALGLFRRAAAQGSAEAAYETGYILTQRQTSQTDIEEARVYLNVAAEGGVVYAYYMLGELGQLDYRNGASIDVALHWYDKAEAAGVANAAARRAEILSLEPPTLARQAQFRMGKNDHAGAYPFLAQSCGSGEVYGCYHQASALADGRGVAQDPFTAMSMFERLCSETEEYGCFEFARTVMMMRGSAGAERNQKAQNIFSTECGTNNQAANECYNVALMSWDDTYGLRSEFMARQYSGWSCQARNFENEACQMQRHFQIEDSWRDFGAETASTKPAEPDFLEGLLYGLAVGAGQLAGSNGNAATQYGEMTRQREADRVEYSIESMRPGSQHYGACPTVSSPGC